MKPYFQTTPLNIVALTTALELLKMLEAGTEYFLTHEERQQALALLEQMQDNSQSTLLEVTNALLLIPSLEQFALTIQKVSLPS